MWAVRGVNACLYVNRGTAAGQCHAKPEVYVPHATMGLYKPLKIRAQPGTGSNKCIETRTECHTNVPPAPNLLGATFWVYHSGAGTPRNANTFSPATTIPSPAICTAPTTLAASSFARGMG